MYMTAIEFGQRIKEIRLACEMTQNELAEITGLRKDIICKIENGKRKVQIDEIPGFVAALGISLEDLFIPPAKSQEVRRIRKNE